MTKERQSIPTYTIELDLLTLFSVYSIKLWLVSSVPACHISHTTELKKCLSSLARAQPISFPNLGFGNHGSLYGLELVGVSNIISISCRLLSPYFFSPKVFIALQYFLSFLFSFISLTRFTRLTSEHFSLFTKLSSPLYPFYLTIQIYPICVHQQSSQQRLWVWPPHGHGEAPAT